MMLIKVFERRSWTWFLALGRRTTHELLSHFMLTLHSCDKKVDSIWKWKNIDGTSKNHLDVTSQSVVFVQTVRLSTKFNFEHLKHRAGCEVIKLQTQTADSWKSPLLLGMGQFIGMTTQAFMPLVTYLERGATASGGQCEGLNVNERPTINLCEIDNVHLYFEGD